jgi:hypothetical protein
MEKRKNPLNPAAQNQERVAVKKQPLRCNWYSTIKKPASIEAGFLCVLHIKIQFSWLFDKSMLP